MDVVIARHREARGSRTAARERPSRDVALADRWDAWHREREDFELASAEELPLAWWRETAKAMLPRLDGMRVLDVGCARGGSSRDLAERGASVTAVDISPTAIAFTQPKLDPHGGVAQVADAADLPFGPGEFDVVVALETLHHVAEPERVLDELVRVARPGGKILITVENLMSLHGLSLLALQAAGRSVASAPVWVPMSFPRVRRGLRRRGCTVLAVEGGGHSFVVPGVGTKEIRALRRIRTARYFAANVCIVASVPS
jgi:2-polyprenyl-3-methyl-5-hydroxy-6-metoxy-1,4-benzoquinol methylase